MGFLKDQIKTTYRWEECFLSVNISCTLLLPIEVVGLVSISDSKSMELFKENHWKRIRQRLMRSLGKINLICPCWLFPGNTSLFLALQMNIRRFPQKPSKLNCHYFVLLNFCFSTYYCIIYIFHELARERHVNVILTCPGFCNSTRSIESFLRSGPELRPMRCHLNELCIRFSQPSLALNGLSQSSVCNHRRAK